MNRKQLDKIKWLRRLVKERKKEDPEPIKSWLVLRNGKRLLRKWLLADGTIKTKYLFDVKKRKNRALLGEMINTVGKLKSDKYIPRIKKQKSNEADLGADLGPILASALADLLSVVGNYKEYLKETSNGTSK